MEQDIASDWDGVRYPREKTTGVVLGLAAEQVTVLGAGIAFIVALMSLGEFPTNAVMALIVAVLVCGIALPRFAGKSLIQWLGLSLKHVFRGALGQLSYVHRDDHELYDDGLPEADTLGFSAPEGEERDEKGRIIPTKGSRFRLPGYAQELRGYRLPGGSGFVYDPRAGEGIVVAKIMTSKAFSLESFELQEDRTGAWRDGLSAVARMPGIARVQASDQTTLISGARVREFYDKRRSEAAQRAGSEENVSGAGIDPFLHASFEDLLTQAQDMPVHEMWLTLVLSKDDLSRRIRSQGGGLRGFMDVALSVMSTVEKVLPDSGTEVLGWHSLRSIAALARSAFDPDSTVEVSERRGDREGVAPSSAGPMALDASYNRVVSDGYFHRTYKVSEFPQSQARLGFLDSFVFAGDFRHTVTTYHRPRPAAKAKRAVRRRKTDWRTSDKLLDKLDREPSLEHEREYEDVMLEEGELIDGGHAPVDNVVLITVTGHDEMSLEANCSEMVASAVRANCELRAMFSEQDEAFIAAALPFGLVDIS